MDSIVADVAVAVVVAAVVEGDTLAAGGSYLPSSLDFLHSFVVAVAVVVVVAAAAAAVELPVEPPVEG